MSIFNLFFIFNVLLAIQFGGLAAFAGESDCGGVDLRGPRLGPARNQVSSSWCYAYSSADLLSYSTGEKISAADIALTYSEKLRKQQGKPFEFSDALNRGGIVKDALQTAMDTGLCKEANLSSDKSAKAGADQSRLQDYYEAIQDELYRGEEDLRLRQAIASKQFLGYHPACRMVKFDGSSISGEMGLAKNVYEMLQVVEDSKKMDPALAIRDRVCKNRLQIMAKPSVESDNVKEGYISSWAPDRLADTIDAQLGSKNPIEIGYYYNFARSDFGSVKIPMLHSSVVVGRRWNKQSSTCEYLIRDSFGPDCKPKNVSNGPNRYNFPCEDGNFWVPRDTLKAQIQTLNYLKSPTR